MLAPTNTLADHAGERNILARLAHNIGTDIGQLHVHLRERILQISPPSSTFQRRLRQNFGTCF